MQRVIVGALRFEGREDDDFAVKALKERAETVARVARKPKFVELALDDQKQHLSVSKALTEVLLKAAFELDDNLNESSGEVTRWSSVKLRLLHLQESVEGVRLAWLSELQVLLNDNDKLAEEGMRKLILHANENLQLDQALLALFHLVFALWARNKICGNEVPKKEHVRLSDFLLGILHTELTSQKSSRQLQVNLHVIS